MCALRSAARRLRSRPLPLALGPHLREDFPVAKTIPFVSHEVRWFFERNANQYETLKHWFEVAAAVPKNPNVGRPAWDDRCDVYLIVPGSDDMGIKWREGELQIKGCVSSLGTQVFCGRHQGMVEHWMKWSYANTPAPYRRLFLTGQETGLVTVSVWKNRALRKVTFDNTTGEPKEVDAAAVVDRCIGFELTQLEVAGKAYYSLAFEASPIDSAMDFAFSQVVEAFLDGLPEINLTTDDSQSYPAWLGRIIEG